MGNVTSLSDNEVKEIHEETGCKYYELSKAMCILGCSFS